MYYCMGDSILDTDYRQLFQEIHSGFVDHVDQVEKNRNQAEKDSGLIDQSSEEYLRSIKEIKERKRQASKSLAEVQESAKRREFGLRLKNNDQSVIDDITEISGELGDDLLDSLHSAISMIEDEDLSTKDIQEKQRQIEKELEQISKEEAIIISDLSQIDKLKQENEAEKSEIEKSIKALKQIIATVYRESCEPAFKAYENKIKLSQEIIGLEKINEDKNNEEAKAYLESKAKLEELLNKVLKINEIHSEVMSKIDNDRGAKQEVVKFTLGLFEDIKKREQNLTKEIEKLEKTICEIRKKETPELKRTRELMKEHDEKYKSLKEEAREALEKFLQGADGENQEKRIESINERLGYIEILQEDIKTLINGSREFLKTAKRNESGFFIDKEEEAHFTQIEIQIDKLDQQYYSHIELVKELIKSTYGQSVDPCKYGLETDEVLKAKSGKVMLFEANQEAINQQADNEVGITDELVTLEEVVAKFNGSTRNNIESVLDLFRRRPNEKPKKEKDYLALLKKLGFTVQEGGKAKNLFASSSELPKKVLILFSDQRLPFEPKAPELGLSRIKQELQ